MVSEQGGPGAAAENMISSVGAMSASVDNFLSSAASGGFKVDQAGGQALIDAINQIEDGLNSAKGNLSSLNQTPKLGTSPGANVTKPFVKQVAGGDEQSFVRALEALTTELDKAKQGIALAMRNYQQADEEQQQAARRLQPGT